MIKKHFYHKIGKPILNMLRQGMSPERLSISIALGAGIGIIPVLESSTLICAGMAIMLRLNLPSIQLSNYLVYPLQISLLIPFMGLGALIFQVDSPPFSVQELTELLQNNFWVTLISFSESILYAVVAWLLVCTPLFLVMYAAIVPVLRKLVIRHTIKTAR